MPSSTSKSKLKEGTKYDFGKMKWSLVPWIVIREVVKVYTGGAVKYDDWNWAKGIHYSRVYDAAMRHLQDWWIDDKKINTDDFNLHHLAHAIWNLIALFFFELYPKKYKKFDDRFKVEE